MSILMPAVTSGPFAIVTQLPFMDQMQIALGLANASTGDGVVEQLRQAHEKLGLITGTNATEIEQRCRQELEPIMGGLRFEVQKFFKPLFNRMAGVVAAEYRVGQRCGMDPLIFGAERLWGIIETIDRPANMRDIHPGIEDIGWPIAANIWSAGLIDVRTLAAMMDSAETLLLGTDIFEFVNAFASWNEAGRPEKPAGSRPEIITEQSASTALHLLQQPQQIANVLDELRRQDAHIRDVTVRVRQVNNRFNDIVAANDPEAYKTIYSRESRI